jgi:hypothetical protein
MPLENTRFAKSGIEKYQLATLQKPAWTKRNQWVKAVWPEMS